MHTNFGVSPISKMFAYGRNKIKTGQAPVMQYYSQVIKIQTFVKTDTSNIHASYNCFAESNLKLGSKVVTILDF
jgi:hypothetical protein